MGKIVPVSQPLFSQAGIGLAQIKRLEQFVNRYREGDFICQAARQ